MLHVEAYDRRRGTRTTLRGGAFANKYIEGRPYTVELVDVSPGGVGIRKICEPDGMSMSISMRTGPSADSFTLELWPSGSRLFAWARRIRSWGDDREAYRILAAEPIDCARLAKFLRTLSCGE
jgi:hypothetical protein